MLMCEYSLTLREVRNKVKIEVVVIVVLWRIVVKGKKEEKTEIKSKCLVCGSVAAYFSCYLPRYK